MVHASPKAAPPPKRTMLDDPYESVNIHSILHERPEDVPD